MKVVILDNLRSVHNVGSIFRTANAVGMDKIFLCGTTPTPLDKKGVKRKDFAKVALGADDSVSWEYIDEAIKVVQKLKEEGYEVIAFEQDSRAVDYKKIIIKDEMSVCFIVGNEVDGILPEVLDASSTIAEIPMLGTKESLNVTIAFGIGVYRILGL